MRVLSESFINNLREPNGILNPILTRVKKDHTLMLAIRDDYVNVYYRGGNILKIVENKKGTYLTYFNEKYNISDHPISNSCDEIKTNEDALEMVHSFGVRKALMDEYFSVHIKPEREFQQLVARENNFSSISNESEYFVIDIEAADSNFIGRIDILAIRWLASQRRSGNHSKAAFIEMKYGDGALSGSAGLLKHLEDIDKLIADRDQYVNLLGGMESQFNQLDHLGLINFNKGKSNAKLNLNLEEKPEVVFILANHNPRSTKLKNILNSPELDVYDKSGRFDLRFFKASFAGYGLHSDCMLTLSEMRNQL